MDFNWTFWQCKTTQNMNLTTKSSSCVNIFNKIKRNTKKKISNKIDSKHLFVYERKFNRT